MLSRTLSRTGYQSDRGRWRKAAVVVVTLATLGCLYWALPKPGPRIRETGLTDEQLRAGIQALTTAPEAKAVDSKAKDLAALGRKLFRDQRLSAAGDRACTTCHDPERAYSQPSGPMSTGLDSPSVANVAFATWFNWNGRSDSLVSQALDAAEDPRQLGTTRVAVARLLLTEYPKDYELAFGPFPTALPAAADLPAQATAARAPLGLSIDVAAHALATVGTYDLLRDILQTAQASRRAPAMELSRRSFSEARSAPPVTWIAAYEALPEATRQAVDEVYVNFGRALAAYQQGLVAFDSPFDRFARRLGTSTPTAEALAAGFGEQELAGLKLFLGTGQCALCHDGPNFSDDQFHNIGLPPRDGASMDLAGVDVGRAAGVLMAKADSFNCLHLGDAANLEAESCRELPYLDSENLTLVGAYKTPGLRNVSATAPYMHDGRFATLDEVLAHYDRLEARPEIGTREGTLRPVQFTDEERAALAAFLTSLASEIRDLNAEESVGTAP